MLSTPRTNADVLPISMQRTVFILLLLSSQGQALRTIWNIVSTRPAASSAARAIEITTTGSSSQAQIATSSVSTAAFGHNESSSTEASKPPLSNAHNLTQPLHAPHLTKLHQALPEFKICDNFLQKLVLIVAATFTILALLLCIYWCSFCALFVALPGRTSKRIVGLQQSKLEPVQVWCETGLAQNAFDLDDPEFQDETNCLRSIRIVGNFV